MDATEFHHEFHQSSSLCFPKDWKVDDGLSSPSSVPAQKRKIDVAKKSERDCTYLDCFINLMVSSSLILVCDSNAFSSLFSLIIRALLSFSKVIILLGLGESGVEFRIVILPEFFVVLEALARLIKDVI